MNYREALDWLYGTQNFGIKLGLEAPRELLRKFLAYPAFKTKVLHVAGTNGKGSVCAMMESLIRGAGHRTGLFTSPHLVHFRERIRVNSLMISESDCADYLTKLRHLAEGMAHNPTFFELTLALAMRYFKDQGVEYIILETGMGGRLDATTAVPADVCVITPIGMDHSQWLGETIEQIAVEKAGIMIEGVPVLASEQHPEVKQVLLEEANMRRCEITMVEDPLIGYSIGIPGEHQKKNAHLAVEAVHEAGVYLNYDTVKECLKYVYWPGRFENVGTTNRPVVLDGAHNPQALNATLNTWELEFPATKPLVIFGAVEEKDVDAMIEMVANFADDIIFTPMESPRSLSCQQLEKASGGAGNFRIATDFLQAWEWAKGEGKPILIVGSLFLIGQAKAMMEEGRFEVSVQ